MAWNEPGKDDKKDPNPWKSGDKKENQSPPDLDVIFQKISDIFSGFFGKKSSDNSRPPSSGSGKFVVLSLIVIIAIGWFFMGWYTVKESDRGVVLRFGAYHSVAEPGLHWNPKFIDTVFPVNVKLIRTMPTTGFMLTQDENLVKVAMEAQYRVSDPTKYLYSVTNADNSLREALDSSLRFVVGHTSMNDVLTTGRENVRQKTWKKLDEIIKPYDMGLSVLDVNLQQTRPPEQVKKAFDDAIAAQEDEHRFVREAEAYERSKEPIARGHVQRIYQVSQAYKQGVILKAEGEVARFKKLLPEYRLNPQVMRERLYLKMMQTVLTNSSKVLIDQKSGGNLTFLPLDKLMNKARQSDSNAKQNETDKSSKKDANTKKSARNTSNDGIRDASRYTRSERSNGRNY
ncbi:MAG: FtsH protease activity modulator HflK [Psychromonas sp.]|nr:FtsH protease activity modulator HflK [Psychromonas sp.]